MEQFNFIQQSSAYEKNDNSETMFIKIGRNKIKVTVRIMESNGDCLFAALNNQINGTATSSDQFKFEVESLRKDVIEYIEPRFLGFKEAIKNTMIDANVQPYDDIQDFECMAYLLNVLKNKGEWGGAETLKAITLIHHVNILVLKQDSAYHYFYEGFKEKNTRTIIIVYRCVNKVYNHYDSVMSMDGDNVKQIVAKLAEKGEQVSVDNV